MPVYDATVAARCKARGPAACSARRTWTSSRWARRPRTRPSARRATRGIPRACPAARAAARRRRSPPGSRRGRSAPTPAARSSSRRRSAATSACGRPTAPSRATAIVAFASSLDQVGPVAQHRARLRAPLLDHRRPRPVRLDDRRAAGAGRSCPRPSDLKGLRIGVPRELNEAEGIEPGVAAAVRAAIAARSELGAEVGECSLPLSVEYGLACYYLIAPAEASSNLARYDGVRYGYRARRRPTSARCTSARATRGSATSRSGGSCSAPTRSRPATTTRTTARRRRCGR